MQSGFYCVVQFQPVRFRREGVNVGVMVFGGEGRKVSFRFVKTAERIKRMFPQAHLSDERLVSATQALARRLLEVEPAEEAVRDFARKEASQLVLLPPLPARVDDVEATVDRLFQDFVADSVPDARVTCPRCDLTFDPAAPASLNVLTSYSVRQPLRAQPQVMPPHDVLRSRWTPTRTLIASLGPARPNGLLLVNPLAHSVQPPNTPLVPNLMPSIGRSLWS